MMVASFGQLGSTGDILSYPVVTIIANDTIGTLSINAEINDAGVVLDGTMMWMGESESLGISAGSILMSGTVIETHFGVFSGAEPKVEFLIRINDQHPVLEAVLGPQQTMIVHDFVLPPSDFIADPWSVSFSDSSYTFGPRVFTTSESFDNADTDGDGIAQVIDNCISVSNGDQRDADNDGIGSLCDFDLNNDCLVNFLDVSIFQMIFLSSNSNGDFNGDGVVNFLDYAKLPPFFLSNYSIDNPSAVPNVCSFENMKR